MVIPGSVLLVVLYLLASAEKFCSGLGLVCDSTFYYNFAMNIGMILFGVYAIYHGLKGIYRANEQENDYEDDIQTDEN